MGNFKKALIFTIIFLFTACNSSQPQYIIENGVSQYSVGNEEDLVTTNPNYYNGYDEYLKVLQESDILKQLQNSSIFEVVLAKQGCSENFESEAFSKLFGYSTIISHELSAFNTCWENALLDANFVKSLMDGNTIYEYIRVVENNRAYELFTLFNYDDVDIYADFLETRLFISEIVDGKYQYVISFDIPERRTNARGGLILVDIDFDGANDVLVFHGHEGNNQGTVRYTAFLNRGNTYIETNFDSIPNPAINSERQQIMGGVRNRATSHYTFLYMFYDDRFYKTDSFIREICLESHELTYIINMRDSQKMNEIFWYESDKEQIKMLFYSDESHWRLGSLMWKNISRFH